MPLLGGWLEPRPAIFRDYVVPNEEASIAADARDLDDDCAYLQFRMPRTLSQIAEMGYDVSGLDSNDSYLSEGDLASARDGRDRSVWPTADYRTGPNRRVWLLEEYARYDLDGDGITELLKVHRVASSILHVETIDEQPGVAWCPFPMPSRITGQSLADKVMDIQRTRSVLFRQGLDNIYQSNAPRFTLNEASIGDSTIGLSHEPVEPWETAKITKLAVAQRVIDAVEQQLRAAILDGELAAKDLSRAQKIERIPEAKRKALFGIGV